MRMAPDDTGVPLTLSVTPVERGRDGGSRDGIEYTVWWVALVA